ncbi:hypothetical protein [Methanohalophilus portucalensis]|nr:hypothetical protein [Methanohalophilus portucalensis]
MKEIVAASSMPAMIPVTLSEKNMCHRDIISTDPVYRPKFPDIPS